MQTLVAIWGLGIPIRDRNLFQKLFFERTFGELAVTLSYLIRYVFLSIVESLKELWTLAMETHSFTHFSLLRQDTEGSTVGTLIIYQIKRRNIYSSLWVIMFNYILVG